MPPHSYSVIVNSCDAFSDTWDPFFGLYETFAGGLPATIWLVTERADYARSNLKITATRANRDRTDRLSWSECLIDALNQIETELVLYFQDDYFLEAPVDVARIDAAVRIMTQNPTVAHVALTGFASPGPFHPSEFESWLRIDARAKYRISLQAGLWRRDTLLSYLRADENAWMLEIFGTRRSWRRNELFLSVDPAQPVPIVYTHTGIIKGRWHPAMPALFAQHGFDIDFSKRGLYTPVGALRRRWQTARTLAASPGRLVKGLLGF